MDTTKLDMPQVRQDESWDAADVWRERVLRPRLERARVAEIASRGELATPKAAESGGSEQSSVAFTSVMSGAGGRN